MGVPPVTHPPATRRQSRVNLMEDRTGQPEISYQMENGEWKMESGFRSDFPLSNTHFRRGMTDYDNV